MKRCKITAIKQTIYEDLIETYEVPGGDCSIKVGQSWTTAGSYLRPEGLCEYAWLSLYPYVLTLASDGRGLFDGLMRNERTAVISCNDGCRPISFLIEVLDD